MLEAFLEKHLPRFSRRDAFRWAGLLAVPAWLRTPTAAAAPADAPAGQALRIAPDIYQSIGVRPFINCRGTLTIIGGSLELPQVRAAKEAASHHYVQLDELMDAVGKRLAELTGAEWGMVSAGCAAAMTHATSACVAGGNPDRHVRLPNVAGMPKDEVIIPKHSRNVYDAAIRAAGVRIIEVDSVPELEAAIGPRTAMIYIFAGPRADAGPPAFEEITRIAQQKNVPVMVDAAAEILTIPNVHLKRGATLVGYSGGKALRGPQCAGLLLGRKDLVQAAWVHSAPHHGYARAMKVGKEEVIGMLAAVEAWVKRDHEAEYKQWMSWMEQIGKRVSTIDGVSYSIREPQGLSNRSPGVNLRWDAAKLGITGEQVSRIVYTTEPRIALGGGGGPARGGGRGSGSGSGTETGISISAWMMEPGEAKIVADRVHQILSDPPRLKPVETRTPVANVTGQWQVQIQFAASSSTHTLFIEQQEGRIQGSHRGDFISRDLAGSMNGDEVTLRSSLTERAMGDALTFTFTGKVSGDTMSGDLDMGEYLKARWTAKRHPYAPGASG